MKKESCPSLSKTCNKCHKENYFSVKCESISLIENEPYSDGTDEGKFWPKAVLPINHNDSIKERT